MKSAQSKLSRRNFLLAGSVAAGAALVAVKGTTGKKSGGKPGKTPDSQGYRLTEHIRNYYRTTQV